MCIKVLFQLLVSHKSHAGDAGLELDSFEDLDLCEDWRSIGNERSIEEKYYLPAERVKVVEAWVLVYLFVITRYPLGMVVLKY